MIINIDDLGFIRERHAGQKIVLTSGTFDLFHVGHLHYLQKVKEHGDIVVVLLSSDARVKARKGPKRPIIPEHDRAAILNAINLVDYVLIDPSKLSPDATDPVHAQLLDALKPEFYVTDGPDLRFIDILNPSQYITLERMRLEPSTSAIIEYIGKLGTTR